MTKRVWVSCITPLLMLAVTGGPTLSSVINWSLTATAIETTTATGNGAAAATQDAPSPYSGSWGESSFYAPYSGTVTINYDFYLPANYSSRQGIVRFKTYGGYPVGDPSSIVYQTTASGHITGSVVCPFTGGRTYWVYVWIYPPRGWDGSQGSVSYSWSASHAGTIYGSDGGSPDVSLVAGQQVVDHYDIVWAGSSGGSIAITQFHFSGEAAEPLLRPRVSVTASPGNSQTGDVLVNFVNAQPTVSLVSPPDGAVVNDQTPTFTFSPSDPNGDGQYAFQLQLSTTPSFSPLSYDTGQQITASTTFTLPAPDALTAAGYYWRVRAMDAFNGGTWGTWSAAWFFRNLPEIAILGNGQSIACGDSSPSAADGSDFGSAWVGGAPVTHVFTVQNLGYSYLTLGPVVVGGSQPDEFVVVSQPGPAVGPGGSTTFSVGFAPSSSGVHPATLSLDNSDSDETPFTFAVQGEGVIPTGSCCYPDGECEVIEEASCTGDWTMAGVCDPNPCPQPLGACCHVDGACTMTVQAQCGAPGVWHDTWASCEPNPCPQPGACCVFRGCLLLLEADCAAAAGYWVGAGILLLPGSM